MARPLQGAVTMSTMHGGGALLMLAAVLGAFGYALAAKSSSGSATSPPPVQGRFTVTGAGRGMLYPGGSDVPVNLVLTNPNPYPLKLTSVSATITGTSSARCATTNFVVARQLTATPKLAPHSTASLFGLGIPMSQWPQLRMPGSGDQSACKGVTVGLSFTGTAKK